MPPISFATANIPSLRAQTNLARATDSLAQTYARLSSGLRINKASDDPAGLILADSLRADSRLASVAIRNANDGISMTSIVDGALDQINNILTRMAELATQSANGSYTTAQRSALSSEFLALGSEIDRIAKATTFNNVGLLSNSSSINFQVGITGGGNSLISMQGVLATLDSVGLAASGGSALSFSIIANNTSDSQSASFAALSAVQAAITSISVRRGTIGATESRLNFAVKNLSSLRENLAAAESKIRDVDVAQETTRLVRFQILQQSATAILAQANQNPEIVLRLLG